MFNHLIVAAGSFDPSTFAGKVTGFIAPIFLLAIAVIAVNQLFRRNMREFIQFAALAVLVGVLFYVPGIVETLARTVAGLFQ